MTVQEVEQNRRVATNVKDVDDKLWSGVVAGGADAVFPGQPKMSAQPRFPIMKSAGGKMGAPGPVDVLGEDVPGGSLNDGQHVTFKNLPPGCMGAAPNANAPKKP